MERFMVDFVVGKVRYCGENGEFLGKIGEFRAKTKNIAKKFRGEVV